MNPKLPPREKGATVLCLASRSIARYLLAKSEFRMLEVISSRLWKESDYYVHVVSVGVAI